MSVLRLLNGEIEVSTSSGLVCSSFGRSWWASEACPQLVLADSIHRAFCASNCLPGKRVEDERHDHRPLWAEDAWAPTGPSRTLPESDHQLCSNRTISTCLIHVTAQMNWTRGRAMASEKRTSDRAFCILRRCSTSWPMGSSICWAMDASQWSLWGMAGTCLSSCRAIRSRFNTFFVENVVVGESFKGWLCKQGIFRGEPEANARVSI